MVQRPSPHKTDSEYIGDDYTKSQKASVCAFHTLTIYQNSWQIIFY